MRPPSCESCGWCRGILGTTVRGDVGLESWAPCHGCGGLAGGEKSMSMSMSMSMSTSIGSSIVMTESKVSCEDFCLGGVRKGFLGSSSSSEVSTGVRAGVRSGLGAKRGD